MSGSGSTNVRAKGRDALMNAMMANQRDMIDGFRHQRKIADVESQLILFNDQIRLARAAISRR